MRKRVSTKPRNELKCNNVNYSKQRCEKAQHSLSHLNKPEALFQHQQKHRYLLMKQTCSRWNERRSFFHFKNRKRRAKLIKAQKCFLTMTTMFQKRELITQLLLLTRTFLNEYFRQRQRTRDGVGVGRKVQ